MTNAFSPTPADWPVLIKQWQQSDLSGCQFCRDHDLVYHQFVYWRKKCTDQTSDESAQPSAFARVIRRSELEPADRLTLCLPGGLSLSGITASNVSLLRSVLDQL